MPGPPNDFTAAFKDSPDAEVAWTTLQATGFQVGPSRKIEPGAAKPPDVFSAVFETQADANAVEALLRDSGKKVVAVGGKLKLKRLR